jgi:hypothetical protein
MGTRAADTLKEIEALRAGLGPKLGELERRLPPIARAGRRAAMAVAGGGAGGSVLWFVLRRRSRARRKTEAAPATAGPAPVSINVLPKGALPVALTIAGIWAGVKVFEAVSARSGRDSAAERTGVVRPIPEGRQARSG